MKSLTYVLVAFASFVILTIIAQNAHARETVHCYFIWGENETLNVQHGSKYVNRSVRNREYNRLVEMGRTVARVAADHGAHCQLNHPENTLIDVRLEKVRQRLDPSGRIPNCADLNARVICYGSEMTPAADFIGTYVLFHDGWRGTLTLGARSRTEVIGEYNSERFGRTYQVTGEIGSEDHRIVFHIHDFNSLPSQRFEGYLFTRPKNGIAGTTNWRGTPFGFFARKVRSMSMDSYDAGPVAPQHFAGRYSFYHDGWHGTLHLHFDRERSLTGTYESDRFGREYEVTATVDPTHNHKIRITIQNFNSLPQQHFDGYLFTRPKNAVAGTTDWRGTDFGFFMYKTRPPIVVDVDAHVMIGEDDNTIRPTRTNAEIRDIFDNLNRTAHRRNWSTDHVWQQAEIRFCLHGIHTHIIRDDWAANMDKDHLRTVSREHNIANRMNVYFFRDVEGARAWGGSGTTGALWIGDRCTGNNTANCWRGDVITLSHETGHFFTLGHICDDDANPPDPCTPDEEQFLMYGDGTHPTSRILTPPEQDNARPRAASY